MRYQLIELAQLVFALSVMFAAFLGGLAVGWWRWGRDSVERVEDRSAVRTVRSAPRASVSSDLFTPADPGHEEVVLAQPVFEKVAQPPRELTSRAEPFS